MGERKYDQALRIKTIGLREWRDSSVGYNRYEATPYKALDALFRQYKIRDNDQVVDFGSGRGRVAFYVHQRFQVPVTGIEVNEQTLDEAFRNKTSYRSKAAHIAAPIRLEYGLAEQYEIQAEDNKFYFFNPFSAEIFKQVVQNIITSVEKTPRIVDIILYYPLPEFKHYLQKSTDFSLINRVKVAGAQDRREQFLIYRLSPESEVEKDV